jgi:hypothetical protein
MTLPQRPKTPAPATPAKTESTAKPFKQDDVDKVIRHLTKAYGIVAAASVRKEYPTLEPGLAGLAGLLDKKKTKDTELINVAQTIKEKFGTLKSESKRYAQDKRPNHETVTTELFTAEQLWNTIRTEQLGLK